MAKQRAQLVILCEDLQQEVFARHYFLQRGFHRRAIRVNRNPRGKGAGEQYVREQYPKQVRSHRSRSSYLSTLLVVMIDADTHTVEHRLAQLDTALTRQDDEKIAIFVPKRNIETWTHYLMGETVDENTAYPKLAREGQCKPYVKKLAEEICPSGLPADAPPSLHAACDELQRIL